MAALKPPLHRVCVLRIFWRAMSHIKLPPSFDLTGFGSVPCLTNAAQARSRTFINQEPKDEQQQP
jgi:hypothetical protein